MGICVLFLFLFCFCIDATPCRGRYNGDIGVLLPDPADSSHLLAWFIGEDGELRRIPPGTTSQARAPICHNRP
jgi:hypothetical protein